MKKFIVLILLSVFISGCTLIPKKSDDIVFDPSNINSDCNAKSPEKCFYNWMYKNSAFSDSQIKNIKLVLEDEYVSTQDNYHKGSRVYKYSIDDNVVCKHIRDCYAVVFNTNGNYFLSSYVGPLRDYKLKIGYEEAKDILEKKGSSKDCPTRLIDGDNFRNGVYKYSDPYWESGISSSISGSSCSHEVYRLNPYTGEIRYDTFDW